MLPIYPSITVGFFYALLVGVSASALVSWHGWMVGRLESDMKVLFVATLPMFAIAFLSFWLLTRKSSHHLPWLSPVALPAIASIACLSASVCLLIYMLRDIETTAHQYYWQHQPELAEVIDGEPVIENLLFQWVDETPTAASTEDRAWLFGEASRRYRLEPRTGLDCSGFRVPTDPCPDLAETSSFRCLDGQ